METNNLKKTVDQFLNPTVVKNFSNNGTEQEVCNLQTGECYTMKSKDGIVERINKKFITEDGRQLLQD